MVALQGERGDVGRKDCQAVGHARGENQAECVQSRIILHLQDSQLDSSRTMDIPAAILLGLATVFLLSQVRIHYSEFPVARGVPLLSAGTVVLIVAIDWFLGKRAILGHPGTFSHTVFKLALLLVLVIALPSGLTAVLTSRRPIQVATNLAWSATVITLVLKFMGVW